MQRRTFFSVAGLLFVSMGGCMGLLDDDVDDELSDDSENENDDGSDDTGDEIDSPAPSLILEVTLEDGQLEFIHNSGDSLNWQQVTVFVSGDVSATDEEIAGESISENSQDAGTTEEYDIELAEDSGVIEVTVRHDASDTVISEEEIDF